MSSLRLAAPLVLLGATVSVLGLAAMLLAVLLRRSQAPDENRLRALVVRAEHERGDARDGAARAHRLAATARLAEDPDAAAIAALAAFEVLPTTTPGNEPTPADAHASAALLRDALLAASRGPHILHGAVSAVAAADDGFYVLGADGLALRSATATIEIPGTPATGLRLLAASRDGRTLAAAADDTIFVWHRSRPDVTHRLAAARPARSLHLDSAGRWLVVRDAEGLRAYALTTAAPRLHATIPGEVTAVSTDLDDTIVFADAAAQLHRLDLDRPRAGATLLASLPAPATALAACRPSGGDAPIVLAVTPGAPPTLVRGSEAHELPGHDGPVTLVRVDPTCTIAATVDRGHGPRLWSLTVDSPGDQAHRLGGAPDLVTALQFHGGTNILGVTVAGDILRWDRRRPGAPARSLVPGSTPLRAAAIASGRWILTLDVHGTGRTFDTLVPAGDAGSWPLAGHPAEVADLDLAADGATLLALGRDGVASLWSLGDADAPALVATFHGHHEAVLTGALDPRGRWVATGGLDGQLRIWPRDARGELRGSHLLATDGAAINALTFDADGLWLAAACSDGDVLVWSVPDAEPPHGAPLRDALEDEATLLVFAGQRLLAGAADGTLLLRHLAADNEPVTLPAWAPHGVLAVAGDVLAVPGRPGTVQLWDLARPTAPPQEVVGLRSPVRALALAGPADRLAASDRSSTLLFDVHDGASHPLAGAGSSTRLIFSADGATLFAADDAGGLLAWSTRAPRLPPIRMLAHTTGIRTLAASADGRFLATADLDPVARVWPLAHPPLLALARSRVTPR